MTVNMRDVFDLAANRPNSSIRKALDAADLASNSAEIQTLFETADDRTKSRAALQAKLKNPGSDQKLPSDSLVKPE